jgi:hypothetical protein
MDGKVKAYLKDLTDNEKDYLSHVVVSADGQLTIS